MRYRLGKAKPFYSALALTSILLSARCIYKLNLQRVSPPNVDLKDFQPVAILSIQDAPGYPQSGVHLRVPVSWG